MKVQAQKISQEPPVVLIEEKEPPKPELNELAAKVSEVGQQINRLLEENDLEMKVVHQTVIVPKLRK